ESSETNGARNLNRVPLERGSVSEFLKVLESDVDLHRKIQIRPDAKGIDFVMSLRLRFGDRWPALICGLPLAVPDQAYLQVHATSQPNGLHQRIVEIKVLTWMNLRAFLSTMEFIHLKRRNRCCFVLCQ